MKEKRVDLEYSYRDALQTAQIEELRRDFGASRISDLVPRQPAVTFGVVRSVTYPGHGSARLFKVALGDGTAVVELIWPGRTEVPGLEPGRLLLAGGLVAETADGLAIMSPEYQIVEDDV